MGRAIVFFATENSHKVEEVKHTLRDYPFEVKQLKVKRLEIQAESIEEIAINSALQISKDYKTPVIVEDTGLFIDALNGFPGPYAAYTYKTLGTMGILKLMEYVSNRKVTFQSAVAFCDLNENITCFRGESVGEIACKAKGDYGFAFDAIFKPYDGADKTFAEMRLEEKTILSHRSKAIRKFADWYIGQL